jgi:hypothetical protein
MSSAGADISGARDFVEENKVAAAAAAARRPVKAEAKPGGGPGAYLHKSEYGQVGSAMHMTMVMMPQRAHHDAGAGQQAAFHHVHLTSIECPSCPGSCTLHCCHPARALAPQHTHVSDQEPPEQCRCATIASSCRCPLICWSASCSWLRSTRHAWQQRQQQPSHQVCPAQGHTKCIVAQTQHACGFWCSIWGSSAEAEAAGMRSCCRGCCCCLAICPQTVRAGCFAPKRVTTGGQEQGNCWGC